MKPDLHIEIKGLSKTYKKAKTKSLDNIHLNIAPGSKVGIFGPNGAGKTTFISLLTNIIQASSGEVNFYKNNSPISAQKRKEILGLVPQDFAFYENLTTAQNLEYFGTLYGLEKKELAAKTKELIESLGLEKHQEKKIKTFSGGMKRRVNLAIGLVHNPELLILDEPTVGVDVQSKHAILQYLETSHKNGTTILYASHLLLEAEQFCDYFVFLDLGKLIAQGKPEDLLKEHNCASLKELYLKLTGEEYKD